MPKRARHVGASVCLLASNLFVSAAMAQAPAPQAPAPPSEVPPVADAPATAAPVAAAPAPPASFEDNLAAMVGRPTGLTAAEVARRASATSSQISVADARVVSARAETDRVLYNSLPRLSLVARYTRYSRIDQPTFGPNAGSLVATTEPAGPLAPNAPLIAIPGNVFTFPQILNQYLLQASLTVPLSDYVYSTGDAAAAARENERAEEVNRQATVLTTQMQAKLLYYDWVRARLSVVAAEKAVEQGRASLKTAKTYFDAGRVSNADVLNAESRLATSELTVERAKTQLDIAEERLRVAMHDPKEARYEIGEDLFRDLPVPKQEGLKDLLGEAKRRRLELRALEASRESLSRQVHVARARGWPRLEAFGNAYYSRPNPRYIPQQDEFHPSWDVGLQLTWSPNDLGTTRSDALKLEAERAKLDAERERINDGLQQEVLEAYTALREAEIGLGVARRNLEASEEAYRVIQVQYQNGRATSLALLDSEARLLQARIDVVNVRVAQRMARVILEHVVGRDVPGGVGPKNEPATPSAAAPTSTP